MKHPRFGQINLRLTMKILIKFVTT